MPNAQNQAMMAAIKEDLTDVSAVWVVDYRGLNVKAVEELRRNIREADASMKVYKNTLVRIALKELDLANMDEVLEGPSAFVFCKNDPVASAKALTEFAKQNDKLAIKGGMMENSFVTADQFDAVASLPSREQLLAQIAGAISGVARGLAVSINGVPSGLAQAIKQVAEQKPAA
ncbi:50S ribosomal protein L10 [Eggerthellaceae bacterium zg-1084]|uniref:Large ribosomal subunit protein uL10 n=1 Tax=Berryella wangjianweii TaxID=2734634 RepID=A0A6M8J3I9_9ACTN|nr:50S ribosomal protein L10 [Berryella wangjianweii]NPD31666.1 50S ribosomal protein L10 [Berryella wangjianweii]NPD32839.1 50S ribosomal protein L10 [Eggerthellaceae bacterium zg-997]QKF07721.1 50S ribosomal protein L10 [Berryella wangjianweii]